jgi:nucleotide-binding universal stress UspA family protein
MYRKVLVPIDGSKPADKALDHATDLVKSISVSSKTELTRTHDGERVITTFV